MIFNSVTDIVLYLPRALQIGYLAPFPDMWFTDGTGPGSVVMRKLVAFEMMIVYIVLFLSVLSWIIKYRISVNINVMLVAVVLVASALIAVYSIAIPNVGTLYRMRMAPWHLLLGFGMVVSINMFFHKK